jgi:hypothetical protein
MQSRAFIYIVATVPQGGVCMESLRLIVIISLWSVMMLACEGSSKTNSAPNGTDGDADGDTDTDNDSDSDGDTDGDSDGDSDGDTDTDGDGDTDTDTDGDGDTDTDTDGDGDGDTDADTDSDTDGDTDTYQDCATVSEVADNKIVPADIIIVVDNSGSMQVEANDVQANLNAFSSQISGSGVDHHIVLISATNASSQGICVGPPLGSGSCPADSNSPNYLHVEQSVDSKDALQKIISTYDQWKHMLRTDSTRHFLVVSDDNSDMSRADFKTALAGLSPAITDFVFHGITAKKGWDEDVLSSDSCAMNLSHECCVSLVMAPARGKVYEELVGETGGMWGDLCLQDFAPVFDALATVVTDGAMSCEWSIPAPPAGEDLDPGKVNMHFENGAGFDEMIGYISDPADCNKVSNGWYYDDPADPKLILVCPQTCNLIQGAGSATVDIILGCETTSAIDECASLTEEAQSELVPVDIIIAVDNSNSMGWEADAVQNAMKSFSSQISASGVDHHIVLISATSVDSEGICFAAPLGSGACPNDSNPPNYLHVAQDIGSNDALEKIHSTFGQWKTMLRPNSVRHFLVVSDDDSDWNASTFTNSMAALNPPITGFVFHAIIAERGWDDLNPLSKFSCAGQPKNECCLSLVMAAAAGEVYMDLITQTGGDQGDLCDQGVTGYQSVFDTLATKVANVDISCEWLIPDPPIGEDFDPAKVNVEYNDGSGITQTIGHVYSESDCGSVAHGWYYDDPTDPTKILVCDQTCAMLQLQDEGNIVIILGCETEPAVVV